MKTQDRGSLLLITIVLIMILLLFGFSFYTLSSVEYKSTVVSADRMQAFYEADGGLSYAKKYVVANYASISTNKLTSATTYELTKDFLEDGNINTNIPTVGQSAPPTIVIYKLTDAEAKAIKPTLAAGNQIWHITSAGKSGNATESVQATAEIPLAGGAGGGSGGSTELVAGNVQPAGGGQIPKNIFDTAVYTALTPKPVTLSTAVTNDTANDSITVSLDGKTVTLVYDKPQHYTTFGYLGGSSAIDASTGNDYIDIFTNNLVFGNASSELLVNGTGIVRIFISNSITINSNAKVNPKSSVTTGSVGNPNQLLIFPFSSVLDANMPSSFLVTTPTTYSSIDLRQNYVIYPKTYIDSLPVGSSSLSFGNWSGK